jgi:hypothetical protein
MYQQQYYQGQGQYPSGPPPPPPVREICFLDGYCTGTALSRERRVVCVWGGGRRTSIGNFNTYFFCWIIPIGRVGPCGEWLVQSRPVHQLAAAPGRI